MKSRKIKRILLVAVLTVLLAIILVPLFWCISLSFDRKALNALPQFALFPHKPSVFNYKVVFQTIPLFRYYANTIFITAVHTFLAVFFALACGYAFAKGDFAGKNSGLFLCWQL